MANIENFGFISEIAILNLEYKMRIIGGEQIISFVGFITRSCEVQNIFEEVVHHQMYSECRSMLDTTRWWLKTVCCVKLTTRQRTTGS